jgi:hypothetical protein
MHDENLLRKRVLAQGLAAGWNPTCWEREGKRAAYLVRINLLLRVIRRR